MQSDRIDFNALRTELEMLAKSSHPDDILLCADLYNRFGFESYAISRILNHNIALPDSHNSMSQIDSLFRLNDHLSHASHCDFRYVSRTGCNFIDLDEFEVLLPFEDSKRETGAYIKILPYLEYIKLHSRVQKIKINCNERLRELFEKYFPYIEIGVSKNQITEYELVEYISKQGGRSIVRNAVRSISERVLGKTNPEYLGINWFANNIIGRSRSIPIGVIINTVGNHSKDFKVKSLQYNNISTDVQLYNYYSKNKIKSEFYNDINTSIVEILDAVKECYCFVGIQSEAAMLAYNVCGIPTIVTASTPHFYWYFIDSLNPYLNTVRMRYSGDYDHITRKINNLL